jgi:predicted DNA-binding protein (UPF0251 family)
VEVQLLTHLEQQVQEDQEVVDQDFLDVEEDQEQQVHLTLEEAEVVELVEVLVKQAAQAAKA